MNNLIEKTLGKIQEQEIKPKSKNYFSLRNLLFWFSAVIMLIFSSFAVSLILFLIFDLDWDIYSHFNHSYIENILIAIPHLWILLLTLFAAIAFYLFKKTKKAYRRSFTIIILTLLSFSLISGTAIYASGLSEKLNNVFKESMPHYKELIHSKEDQWMQSEDGLLSGKILNVENDSFNIEDFNGNPWKIIYNENTNIKGRVDLSTNSEVKIIGEVINDNEFRADEIRPWGRGRNQQ